MLRSRSSLLAFGVVLALAGCKPTAQSDKAKAAPAEEAARELTPKERVGWLQAEFGVVNALTMAAMVALRGVPTTPDLSELAPPPEVQKPDAKQLTIFFTANNHAEREDCGCRKNPLGGLDRRHTLLEALEDPGQSQKWWGREAAPGPVFHLDAGDSIFINSTIDRGTPNAQKIAKHDGRAVVDALNTFPPDAMLVGELELVFGVDELKALEKRAKFPFISANVQSPQGELLWPGHLVVERDGRKIGVVGVTKQKTRYEDYWNERKVQVTDPLEAAKTAIAKLPEDVDLVVLLSNLGLNDSEKLVTDLRAQNARVDFVVVSSSNRMTEEPQFAAGVPLVEPLSRGKYVGRADFVLNGPTIEFRNASMRTSSSVNDYRRALRSYHIAKKQLIRDRQKIAELEMSEKTVANQAQNKPDAGKVVDELQKRRQDALASQKKRVEMAEGRLATISQNLLESLAALDKRSQPATGDDWIAAHIAPVKIEIEQAPQTRKVLDKAARTRPKEERQARGR